MALRESRAPELILPVGLAVDCAGSVLDHLLLDVGRITGGVAVHLAGAVVPVHIFAGVHQFGHSRIMDDRHRTRIADLRLAFSAALGGDEDYAVGALHTVDGSSCILENRNAFDIVGVDVIHTGGHTIDDAEWSAAGEVVETAHVDRRSVRTRTAGRLDGGKTCDLTCEQVRGVGHRSRVEFLGRDRRH